jgi:hypothetical protein
MYKTATALSDLMIVGTVHFHVMLVLQNCTDSQQILPGSSCGTFPSSSDGTYGIGYIKYEEDMDIREEEKVNVKA